MSRSNPQKQIIHPAARWFRWNAKRGKINFWKKPEAEGQKGHEVDLDLPFSFLYLDELSTITGFNKRRNSFMFSNEVRDTRESPLTVKFFEGRETIATGLYANIKPQLEQARAKFAASIYLAYKEGDELKIGNIQLSGFAVSSWMDFKKKNREHLESSAVVISGTKIDDTSGDDPFHIPQFKLKEVTEETNTKAIELDRVLQAYLEEYLQQHSSQKVNTVGESVQDHPRTENQETPDETADRIADEQSRGNPDLPADDDVPF